jgi:hypothetical protein
MEAGAMRMHHVEVDQEVFAFVKEHAEPLVDTFNSALRRLLPFNESERQRRRLNPENKQSVAEAIDPSSATEMTQALRQILWVATLVYEGTYSRTEATRYVAKQLNVAPQTVLDKYCRQLDLTANQFDRLLAPEKIEELKILLRAKFPEHADAINRAFRNVGRRN